jgi:hypothetical protein
VLEIKKIPAECQLGFWRFLFAFCCFLELGRWPGGEEPE